MLKTKLVAVIALISLFLTTTAFSNPDLHDNCNLVEKETSKLIKEKNNRYLQTSEQPKIIVKTVNRVDHLTPKKLSKYKRTVFIVVGYKDKKKNVQIYSSKDLHSAFTADIRGNIIRSQSDQLRSNNKKEFNKGLRFVFRACATTIDQRYQYALDKYDLSNDERTQLTHPRRLALPIALALVLVIGGLLYFFKTNMQLKK
ncbi:TPM domain-containing protein [Lactobacillus sp. M0403]|nr:MULTISPECIES: TPM domain-containing protein [Lactobacillus]MBI0022483.1 TPM domain-containing protein [Lactobacillus sp. W8172]MBI0092249.1 TPM domain-containing protein [Lactobacillus sp. M0403]WLS85651.1 TPM domain-containing protein [Lactobacillus apis]